MHSYNKPYHYKRKKVLSAFRILKKQLLHQVNTNQLFFFAYNLARSFGVTAKRKYFTCFESLEQREPLTTMLLSDIFATVD